MKKLLTFLALLSIGAVWPRWAAAENIKRSDRDIATWQHKGSSQVALGISSHGIVYNEQGLSVTHESFRFLATPSTFSIFEGITTTSTLAALPAGTASGPQGIFNGGITQPRYPSPITVNFTHHPVASNSTSTFVSTITISGFDSTGSSRTVKLRVSSMTASTGFAFAYISSVTLGVFSSTRLYNNASAVLTLGTTNQIGLAVDIVDSGDAFASVENNTNISSFTINAAFNTYQPTVPLVRTTTTTVNGAYTIGPLGNTHELWYRVRQSPPHRKVPDRPTP